VAKLQKIQQERRLAWKEVQKGEKKLRRVKESEAACVAKPQEAQQE